MYRAMVVAAGDKAAGYCGIAALTGRFRVYSNFPSNSPSITFAESELLSVVPNTLADVLEGRAAEVEQNRLIGTVTTGVHDEYVEQGPA